MSDDASRHHGLGTCTHPFFFFFFVINDAYDGIGGYIRAFYYTLIGIRHPIIYM